MSPSSPSCMSRRQFLWPWLPAATGAVLSSTVLIPRLISEVLAQGSKGIAQGFGEIAGDVRVNGKPAVAGDPVRPGDVVTTGGPPSRAVFTLGADAFLLRENTRLEVSADWASSGGALSLAAGKLLSVLASGGQRRLKTSTAVIGIRGTACYLEIDPDATYLCPCYGEFDLFAASDLSRTMRFTTQHHEHPQFIHSQATAGGFFSPGPMRNHTDAELTLLEALVGRKPPFLQNLKPGESYPSKGNGY